MDGSVRVGVQDFLANPAYGKSSVRGTEETHMVGRAKGTSLCTEIGCSIKNTAKQARRLFLYISFKIQKV